MGSHSLGESRRKHRRSSPSADEEAERASKRHKHRHHRRSHRSRKHGEHTKRRGHEVDSTPPAAAPILTPGDDLEEGEILEEEVASEFKSENRVCWHFLHPD